MEGLRFVQDNEDDTDKVITHKDCHCRQLTDMNMIFCQWLVCVNCKSKLGHQIWFLISFDDFYTVSGKFCISSIHVLCGSMCCVAFSFVRSILCYDVFIYDIFHVTMFFIYDVFHVTMFFTYDVFITMFSFTMFSFTIFSVTMLFMLRCFHTHSV